MRFFRLFALSGRGDVVESKQFKAANAGAAKAIAVTMLRRHAVVEVWDSSALIYRLVGTGGAATAPEGAARVRPRSRGVNP